MILSTIEIRLAETIPNGTTQYANHRPEICLRADLEPGDDFEKCKNFVRIEAVRLLAETSKDCRALQGDLMEQATAKVTQTLPPIGAIEKVVPQQQPRVMVNPNGQNGTHTGTTPQQSGVAQGNGGYQRGQGNAQAAPQQPISSGINGGFYQNNNPSFNPNNHYTPGQNNQPGQYGNSGANNGAQQPHQAIPQQMQPPVQNNMHVASDPYSQYRTAANSGAQSAPQQQAVAVPSLPMMPMDDSDIVPLG